MVTDSWDRVCSQAQRRRWNEPPGSHALQLVLLVLLLSATASAAVEASFVEEGENMHDASLWGI